MELSMLGGDMSNNTPKSWIEKYGPIISAGAVIGAALLGIWYAHQQGYIAPFQPRDFSFTASPPIGDIEQGGMVTVTLSIQSAQNYGFPVRINVTEQPPGIQVLVDPHTPQVPPYDAIGSIHVDTEVDQGSYTVKFSAEGGDGKSHALSYPLRVRAASVPTTTPLASVSVFNAFYASGWMGDWGDISLNDAWSADCHSPPTCVRFAYSGLRSQGFGWAGLYWQYPDKNWGDNPDGRDLTGATKLTFWAKGRNGGEKAEFKVGGITGKYPDSIQPAVPKAITLSSSWQGYAIDLRGKDLHHVIGGFVVVMSRNDNPNGATLYLDDVQFEA